MLSVGLSLTSTDFRSLVQQPRLLVLGLVLKMLIFPVIGLCIANLMGLPPTFQLGVLLLLICPGGTTSNAISYWFSGNIALIVTLTAVSSLIAVVSIPVIIEWAHRLYFGDQVDVHLPFLDTIASIFFIVLTPVVVGMFIRWKFEKKAVVAEKIIKNVSLALLGVVYLIKFFASKENGGTEIHKEDILTLLPVLLTINVFGMLFGYLLSRLFRLSHQNSMTLGVEVGLSNISLAIVVGSLILENEDFVKPGLIYAMFSFWTTALFAFTVRKLFFEKNWTK